MKNSGGVILLFFFASILSCGLLESSNNENLIAFHAYNSLGSQIYTINFDAPKNSLKNITNNDHSNTEPVFSNGKERLVFSDRTLWLNANFAQLMYNFSNNSIIQLSVVDNTLPLVYSHVKLWHPSNNSLYFDFFVGHTGATDVYSYKFDTKRIEGINLDPLITITPIGILHTDTLIVTAVDKTLNIYGVYRMDLEGNIHRKFNNPHFDRPFVDGRVLYGPYRFHYSMELSQFLLAIRKENERGFRIAATNIDGSYYEEFTSGEYIDDFPVFGPNNEFIIFSRRDIDDYIDENSKLMYINISDRTEHILIDKNMYPNLYGFNHPTF